MMQRIFVGTLLACAGMASAGEDGGVRAEPSRMSVGAGVEVGVGDDGGPNAIRTEIFRQVMPGYSNALTQAMANEGLVVMVTMLEVEELTQAGTEYYVEFEFDVRNAGVGAGVVHRIPAAKSPRKDHIQQFRGQIQQGEMQLANPEEAVAWSPCFPLCKELRPKPGYVMPPPDGCTASPDTPPVSILPWVTVDFKPCCDAHDVCYRSCGTNKIGCDANFLECMIGQCHDTFDWWNPLRYKCDAIAMIYYGAVSTPIGWYAFCNGQRAACECVESVLPWPPKPKPLPVPAEPVRTEK